MMTELILLLSDLCNTLHQSPCLEFPQVWVCVLLLMIIICMV